MNNLSAVYQKKNKATFAVISFKDIILPSCFVLFTVGLVMFSNSNLIAAKAGLKLWANNVVPSLFPFFVATHLLSSTDIISCISKSCNKIMRPLFNVPGESAYAFILGLISGYPVGAKIVTNLRNAGLCSNDEGERMLCFTNNSGPLFIIGTVGISMFANSTIGLLLFITHILSAITVGFILGLFSKRKNASNTLSYSSYSSQKTLTCNFKNLGTILSEAIVESSKTLIMIGGFVVIFSVIISILNTSKILEAFSVFLSFIFKLFNIDLSLVKPVISGIIELTNGISLVTATATKNISTTIILCAFLLGFGGISVLLQVLSIISKSNLSIKKYIYGKLLQGIIASTYTYILITAFPILNFNL